MRLFRFVAQFFHKGAIYCEDCMHCVPEDEHQVGGPKCDAYLITIDNSDKDTYVKRGAEVRIVKSYKSCKDVRSIKSLPVIYDETCWKFDKKVKEKT